MAFQPGNKLGLGRPKGSPNKQTLAIKEQVETYLGKTLPEAILEKISQMQDPDKAAFALLALLNYLYPKRTPVSSDGMTEAEIDRYNEIKKQPLDVVKAEVIKLVANK